MLTELFSPTPTENLAVHRPVDAHTTLSSKPRAGLLTAFLAVLRRPTGALLAALVTVFAAYAPTLNAQFVWDDNFLVKGNLLIRSPLFVVEAFRHTLFGDASNFYRPTQTLTFIADYWVWALDPFGYHLTSILIHALNAFLLCLVLRLVLPAMLPDSVDRRRADWIALGVSVVWAVHPVHSAAVAYVSGMADTLAMTFCLVAVLLCERALDAACPLPRVVTAAGAVLCMLLGLCAKEIASIWLVLYLGYLFGLRPGSSRHARWSIVALAGIVLLAYLGLRHLPPPITSPSPTIHLPAKGTLMLRALGDYGSLLLFPDKLFMERQVFSAPGLANAQDEFLYNTLTVSGALVLVAFAVGCWWAGRGQRLRRVGAIWFMVGFLPISNLFALNSSVAEHWLYLPSIGFLLFLVGVGLELPALRGRSTSWFLTLSVVVIVGALGLRTWYRSFDWMDEVTFFRQTIANGGDVPRARAGLASAYGRQAVNSGEEKASDQAVAMLRDLVRRYPKVTSSRINLANLLAQRGETAEARTLLATALDDLSADKNGDSHQIVTALKRMDTLAMDDDAWAERRRILLGHEMQRHPGSWDLVEYEIAGLERDHEPEQALAAAKSYTDAHWWHAPAHRLVGQLEASDGQVKEALATWINASRLDVYDVEALDGAARLSLKADHLHAAHDFLVQAIRRQPASLRLRATFAQVLYREGDHAAAQAQIALAKSLVNQAEEN